LGTSNAAMKKNMSNMALLITQMSGEIFMIDLRLSNINIRMVFSARPYAYLPHSET
jgi:hypothetical protein